MRTITGLFDSRPEAERAVESIVQEYGIDRGQVQVHAAGPDNATAGTDERRSESHHRFGESLHGLGLPKDDHASYSEGLRRGGILVSVQAPDDQHDQVAHAMERAGAVDVDAREAEWRQGGWTGGGGGSWTGGGGAAASEAAGRVPDDAGTSARPLSTYAGLNRVGVRGTDEDVTAPANEGVASSPPVRPAAGPAADAAARSGMSTSDARQPPAHATSAVGNEGPQAGQHGSASPEQEDAGLRANPDASGPDSSGPGSSGPGNLGRDTSGGARRVRSYTQQAGRDPAR